MSRLQTRLAQLEARLQSLIEEHAARLFFTRGAQNELPARLVEAMQSGIRSTTDGALLAPNLFTLVVHPDEVQLFRQNQELLDHLAQVIQQSGVEAGLYFTAPPTIKVTSDSAATPRQVNILAQISLQHLSQTATLTLEPDGTAENIPANAFLIVGGTEIYSLNRPVVNIGRRVDNHLVIDDPRVSRVHAQLRAIRGRFLIFDLDSTGGTFVNGERIRQATLYPGDVISLSGVALVFGQDSEPFSDDGMGSTHPIVP